MPPAVRSRNTPLPTSSSAPPTWIAGQQWAQLRLRQPGWLILPLRGFLAVTFIYAGLQKLANPAYLNPNNPTSVVGQMKLLRHTSPIGPLLGLSLHAPTLVGLMIAFGELAVGVGVLIGLWTRLAALGGMALSLTFLLTVSWNTTPYYYGSDIVFLFAWMVIAFFGSGNVLSLDGWRAQRARAEAGLQPLPAVVTLEVPRLREICPRQEGCGLGPAGDCRRKQCGVFPAKEQLPPAVAEDVDRRRILIGGRAAVIGGLAVLATGGITAWLGRLAGGTSSSPSNQSALGGGGTPKRTPHRSPHHSSQPTSPSGQGSPSGTAIGKASVVPVGQAGQFTDPATGQPAYLVHTSTDNFVAFSAVCTHAGCTVQFEPGAMQFICPCHGGTYSAKTGQVLGGPPPSPLPSIPVHVVNGEIRVD